MAKPSWITLSKTSGSGNGSVTVTAAENTSTSSRSGSITITSGSLTRTVSVSQAARATVTPSWSLGSSTSCTAAKDTIGIEIYDPDSVGWKITSSVSWISTTSGSGANLITLTVSANTSTLSRSGTIYLKNSSGTTTYASCTVTQAAEEAKITVTLYLESANPESTAWYPTVAGFYNVTIGSDSFNGTYPMGKQWTKSGDTRLYSIGSTSNYSSVSDAMKAITVAVVKSGGITEDMSYYAYYGDGNSIHFTASALDS